MSPSVLLVALPLLAAAAAVADDHLFCSSSSIGYISGRTIQYEKVAKDTPVDFHFPPVCAAAQGLLVVACVSTPPLPTVAVISLNEAYISTPQPVNAVVSSFAFCADGGAGGTGGARATYTQKDILSLIGALPGGGMMRPHDILPLNAGAPGLAPADRYHQLRWKSY